ncbi:E3 ubiquitin-protein ligase RNF213-like [Saccoglossus kowalevskii]
MKISDFLSLKENEAEFETLCSLICHKTDNLQTLFKCRQQEHSAWKAESQLVHIFYDKTQAILKQDEGTEIKEKLKLSQNEVKFKNICNPNEYSNASVDSYSPAITMYPFTEEQKTMLTTMETYQHSRIMIYFWNETLLNVRQKVVTSKPRLSIKELETTIWTPTLQKIFDLKRDVEKGTITLADIDKVFNQFDRNVENIQTELSMIADGNLGQWVELRTRQIRIYYNVSSVYMAAGIVLNLKETYDLTGDFKSVELLSTKGKDFKNQLLKSITEDLDRTGKMLSGFTKERCKSLQVYIEQKKLIDWVKKEMKGINDMKAFLDLSMRVVGEGDMEVDTIGVLDQAVSGYAPLIFDLSSSDGSTKFLKQCNKLWETLTRDPRLPKKLKETGESLDYLIKLQKSHGEDEETSLNQACNINRRGVYHVGHLECDDYKLDLKSSIRLTVLQQRGKRKQKQDEADAINREYSLDDLKDIQSRLMLISHREEEHSEIVERYITLMDLVIRMAETYLKLRSAGCVSFIDWKVIQHCQPAKRVTTNVFFGASDPMITGSEDAADSMYKLCDFLERCHHQWLEYINRKRRGYYELNHFTMTQIFQLRRDLAKLRNNEDIHPSTCVLLEGVRTNCGITNLREALRESNNIQNTPARSSTYQPPSCPSGLYMSADMKNTSIKHLIAEGMTDKIAKAAFMACGFDSDINLLDWCYAYLNNDDIIDAFYVQYIEQYEDSPMDKTPRLFPLEEVDDTAGTSMIQTPQVESGKQISSVTDQLEALWTHKLESEDAITQGDYITVEHLGKTLECLANDERSLLNRPLKRFIVPGQPNLVICSHENILSFVLSIYMEDTSLPLPTVEEVLLCTEHTTAEAVSLFWHRAFLDTRGGIFCLAFADQLSYEVCSASEHILNKLQSSLDKKDYRVLVICSKERENQSYMVSALDHFKTDTRFVPDMVAITAYLMDKFQEECSITTHDGFSTGMVTDMRSSVLTIQSNRSGTGKSLFVERLSTELEARTNHHRESPYCITLPLARKNIDLSSVVHSFSRCIEIDNETHSIFHLDISPLNKARVTPRFQDLLPVISCQSPRESLATLDKADGGKRVLHMDNEIYRSDNLQMSYQYLAAFQKEQNLDKLQYSGQATESPTQCLLTLLQYCGVADPSWAELNNFTSFLGEQLKDCEDSVFCDPYNLGDTELEGFKTFVVKFMIAMSKDFATPSVKTSNQSVDANGDNDNGLERFQLRRTWENSPHPYIFFNRDHITMTFLGFTIDEMGNLLESGTGNILEPNVMSAQLQRGLTEQHVDLTVDIMHVSRDDMLNKLYLVFGTQETYDPDPTYELTIDNVKKMMAIHMRFRSELCEIELGFALISI